MAVQRRKKIKVKSDGSFTAYCKRHGFKGANMACVRYAKAHGSGKIVKKAVFYQNFVSKRRRKRR